jgi:hypothetical protein
VAGYFSLEKSSAAVNWVLFISARAVLALAVLLAASELFVAPGKIFRAITPPPPADPEVAEAHGGFLGEETLFDPLHAATAPLYRKRVTMTPEEEARFREELRALEAQLAAYRIETAERSAWLAEVSSDEVESRLWANLFDAKAGHPLLPEVWYDVISNQEMYNPGSGSSLLQYYTATRLKAAIRRALGRDTTEGDVAFLKWAGKRVLQERDAVFKTQHEVKTLTRGLENAGIRLSGSRSPW